jgi:hypothetical protein
MPPRRPSAGWWVLTTNSLTCLPKHGFTTILPTNSFNISFAKTPLVSAGNAPLYESTIETQPNSKSLTVKHDFLSFANHVGLGYLLYILEKKC